MNREEYIAVLEKQLIRLPKAERDDILSDYESHFALGEQAGKTQEEVAAALGDPYELAARYLENLPSGAKGGNAADDGYQAASYGSAGDTEEKLKTSGVLIVVLLSVFIAAPILGSLLSAWFAVIPVVLAVAVLAGVLFGISVGVVGYAALAGVGLIFISVALLALCGLLICGLIAAAKGMVWLVKWYIGFCKKMY